MVSVLDRLVVVVMVGDVEGVVLPLVALHQPQQEVSLADPHLICWGT